MVFNLNKVIFKILIVSIIILNSQSFAAELIGDIQPKLSGDALIHALQKGGYIIYFRHGATGKRGEKNVMPDKISDCSIQRNLSDAGVEQTKAIGKAIKKLAIPINEVYSSPYCRCMDTAMNIFGKATKSDHLYFAIHVKKSERKPITEKLLKMLATPPPAGVNTAIVSHTANLREAVNIWPKPEGVAHIFKPEKNQQFSYIGVIQPDEWLYLSNTTEKLR